MQFHDRSGREIRFIEWVIKWTDSHYRWIEQTPIGDWTVSTMWVGVGSNLFQTSIFGPGELHYSRWSYVSEIAAVAGHREAVALAQLEASLDDC